MFDNIGGAEMIIIALVGLFVIGPERLPAAASWVADTVRSIRDFATGARDQLRTELGPEYEQFRQPLEDLRSVRDLDPRRAVREHLDPRRAVREHLLAPGEPAAPGRAITGATDTVGRPAGGASAAVKGRTSTSEHRAVPLTPGEAAPFDADAT